MANRGGRQCFLAKAGYQIRVVADQVGQNDLDGVLGFEKDVARFVDDPHATLAQTFFELITSIQNRLSLDRRIRFRTVIGTVINVVREARATSWALFHSLVSTTASTRRGLRDFRKRILAAAAQASKQGLLCRVGLLR